jgi:hypothetical protein
VRSGDSCLHLPPNIIPLITLRIRFVGHAVFNEGGINGGNPDEKRPLTIPTRTWQGNIKMGLEQRQWVAMNWIGLGSGHRHVRHSCEHGDEPSDSTKFLKYLQ